MDDVKMGANVYVEYKDNERKVKMLFPCRLVDRKFSYGKHRYKVAPLNGEGETWVEKILPIVRPRY